jgi:hypothetical protein
LQLCQFRLVSRFLRFRRSGCGADRCLACSAGAGAGDKTEEHVEGEDTTAYDKDATGYDRR